MDTEQVEKLLAEIAGHLKFVRSVLTFFLVAVILSFVLQFCNAFLSL